jgi:hypothetical protein
VHLAWNGQNADFESGRVNARSLYITQQQGGKAFFRYAVSGGSLCLFMTVCCDEVNITPALPTTAETNPGFRLKADRESDSQC